MIGHPHRTGIIEIVEEMASLMKGKDLKGGHCHPLHLFCHHFLTIVVVDGLEMLDREAALQ